jgi:hypothetical protein
VIVWGADYHAEIVREVLPDLQPVTWHGDVTLGDA